MIYSITGKITSKDINYAVVETAGIGFKIFVLNDLAVQLQIGKRIKLLCVFYPEQAELFGFLKQSEKSLFEMLNSVSGIGPKIAIKIMNSLDTASLKGAIVRDDLKMLKDAGMSTKTASKIILELKDKIEKEGVSYGKKGNTTAEIKEALRSLGYSKNQVDEVVSDLPSSAKTIEEKVKAALKIFAKQRRT
jgi:Holliday junction DNA helicase RuvA